MSDYYYYYYYYCTMLMSLVTGLFFLEPAAIPTS